MTVAKPVARPPSLADLDALPPGIVGEIIEGVLYTMTKPRMRHQLMALAIASDLRSPFGLGRGGPGGWWIVTEPWIELPNTPEIAPNVGGWHQQRMPSPPPPDEPIRMVPDWVCEVLSSTTRRHDLLVKLPYYAKVGVTHHWLVDLEARVIIVHRLESEAWRLIGTYSNEAEARLEPFHAIPLNVADWWPPQ